MNQLSIEEAYRNYVYRQYRYKAGRRNLSFDLTIDQFEIMIKCNCYYCGSVPASIVDRGKWDKTYKREGQYYYNGIDRVDNSKGYSLDNIVPCCSFCNLAKNKKTKEEFEQWINRLVEYRVTNGKESKSMDRKPTGLLRVPGNS